MNKRQAIRAINEHGILLTFPIKNSPLPLSLWSAFFPKSKMRWEWDDNGDSRVANLWHLREELSRSGEVVYAKWFQGRATFFSKEIFIALLQSAQVLPPPHEEAERLFEILSENSPLSTKLLKKYSEMQGKFFESTFDRALKALWQRLWIVGYGEEDDGAFPSLRVGATALLFEELWDAAKNKNGNLKKLRTTIEAQPPLLRFYKKLYEPIKTLEGEAGACR